jgi:HrpA-like RNA helicase
VAHLFHFDCSDIPGRTFPVKDYMLEDVLSITGYIPSNKGKGKAQNRPRSSTPSADSEASDVEPEDDEEQQDQGETAEQKGNGGGDSSHSIPIDDLVDRMGETNVDYDLLARLVKHLIVKKDPADDGSVLVFLPGAPEINRAMEAIKRVTKDLPLRLLPLHGGLQPKDQNLVFKPVGGGLHKVILSTNVAET